MNVDPARLPWVLLRSGGAPGLVTGFAAVLLGLVEGAAAVAGAALGATLSLAALAVGPLLLRLARDSRPELMFALALSGYMLVVIVLGIAYQLLADVTWLSSTWLGGSVLACTVAWVAGQAVATFRLRVLAFGDRVPPG